MVDAIDPMRISFRAAFGESRGVAALAFNRGRGESAAVIVGGKVFRVIDGRCWDATRRFDDMAAADDGDVQVVSPMRELLLLWFPPADTDGRCGHVRRG